MSVPNLPSAGLAFRIRPAQGRQATVAQCVLLPVLSPPKGSIPDSIRLGGVIDRIYELGASARSDAGLRNATRMCDLDGK